MITGQPATNTTTTPSWASDTQLPPLDCSGPQTTPHPFWLLTSLGRWKLAGLAGSVSETKKMLTKGSSFIVWDFLRYKMLYHSWEGRVISVWTAGARISCCCCCPRRGRRGSPTPMKADLLLWTTQRWSLPWSLVTICRMTSDFGKSEIMNNSIFTS